MTTARERLIDTAMTLFYKNGLTSTGINEITDSAGVASMSLYNNFDSKEDLAVTAYQRISDERLTQIRTAMDRARSSRRKIESLFDVAQRLAKGRGYCGCAFINVAGQAPDSNSQIHQIAQTHKLGIIELIESAMPSMRKAKRQQLARQVLMLWDGAVAEAFIQQDANQIAIAKKAALQLYDLQDT